ncbi:hypothetical protein ACQ33O_00855 [Ferruginibacter sp. SUN002]|uniref:hypothetical protein n=1 Tax=Ferruginibacter sp. SUN002 TaxID=2937789 RepID=UPI003D36877F
MNEFNIEILTIKKRNYFCGITIFIYAITFFIEYFFYTDSVYYSTYTEQLSLEKVQEILDSEKKYRWLGYLIIPISLILKVLYNSFWVTIGSLLNNERSSFKHNYNICLKAEYVFVLRLLVKFCCLVIYKPVNTLYDLAFVPGALSNLFPISSTPQWYQYPLQTINIWELLYCFVGTSMYAIQHNVSKSKAAAMFCIPYLIGLAIWVLIVVFFTLQFS